MEHNLNSTWLRQKFFLSHESAFCHGAEPMQTAQSSVCWRAGSAANTDWLYWLGITQLLLLSAAFSPPAPLAGGK